MDEADSIIAALDLKPHPEGGYYREVFRDVNPGGRDFSTAIYFLLKAGQASRWHRVDAVEIWHWHRGAALELMVGKTKYILGPGIERGERPQGVVPKCIWQAARSLGAYTLVGCTVAPGFDFAGFEMAPDGWEP
jgi:predicted cupin superfamily sugar epimerase